MAVENEKEKIDASDDTKKVILNLLLEGPKTAGQIADKLKIQKSAIRSHLESLRADQAIRSYFKTEGPGRPSKIYEITNIGRELFPRKYDLFLLSVLQNIEATEGHEYAKKIIKTVADNMAKDIQNKIRNTSSNIEESLSILNSISNEMGFMSSLYKDDGDDDNNSNTYSIVSRNCIVHKVAVTNQDAICNGFHSRMIQKALEGKINPKVQLKECIALGDNYSRHAIAIK
jgi:DeoR family suf operon transcriptional repressor